MIPRDLVTLSQYGPYRTSGSGTFRYARTHNHQNTCVKEPRSLSFTSLAMYLYPKPLPYILTKAGGYPKDGWI